MDWYSLILDNWHVKLVCVTLIVAAYIDGKQLRVPNWLTFPMVLSGLAFNLYTDGWGGSDEGLCGALLGVAAGLGCLLPLYAVGGMGAGDVKLMAGIGAWLGWHPTLVAFVWTAVVGAAMAVLMVLYKRRFQQHYANFLMILTEWWTVRSPKKLSEIAAERKPTMFLLPYGIPICIGSIAYFLYAGLL